MRALILIACLLVPGCAVLEPAYDVASKPETLTVCKVADVSTTIYALHSGNFAEANPVMKVLIGAAPHYLLLIGASVAFVALVNWIDNPTATAVASAETCAVSAHNAYLLLK